MIDIQSSRQHENAKEIFKTMSYQLLQLYYEDVHISTNEAN